MHAAIAVAASLAIASLARAARALTASGAIAAFAVGSVVFSVGDWPGATVLLAFFLSSSVLSRIGARRKHALADWGKQGARDARQVLANGGVATVCIGLTVACTMPWCAALLWLGFAAAFASATADTWATEIGSLGRGARSIVSFRPVGSGVSGGVSLPGTLAQIAGAAFIAAVAQRVAATPFWPVAIAGVAGGFFDSILGATVQALRWCPHCERRCEITPHSCGTATTLLRGLRWMDNDAVNFLATLFGAGVAIAIAASVPVLR